MDHKATHFSAALRPFSLVVALATCALGISLAAMDGYRNPLLAGVVVGAALLLQAGVNLINDYPDLAQGGFDDSQRRAIRRNAMLGAGAILLACLAGLWIVSLRGWPMLVLGLTGLVGGWSYADGPINFKARGLGVVAVFFLTGILMVEGAYFAMSGTWSARVAWLAVPFSLFASLLLLANELRDYERDVVDGHRTFSVRFGYRRGVRLYQALVLALAASTLVLALVSGQAGLVLPMLALVLLWVPLRRLDRPAQERGNLARMTGRCYFAYSLSLILALWMPGL